MVKKIKLCVLGLFVVGIIFPIGIPQVAITFGLSNGLAQSIVNYVLAASTVASVVSLIGIIFGVGGFTLAAVQMIKYLAKKSFGKAVTW